jgi:prepilin-type N-terminal cleavage/methylation domain-containing protein
MTNKNGFSLVEIMLAIGLLGVLSTGIMKMFKLQTKSGKVMETQLEILQVYNSITLSLLNKEACSSTFSAVPQFENDAEVEFINNRAGNSIFNTTDIYGERTVKIEKMLIKDLAVESSGFGNFKLELHFKKQSKLLAGSKGLVVKTIPISAKVDSLNHL